MISHVVFMLQSGRIGAEEEIDDYKGKSHGEIEEILAARQAKANAQLLEMVRYRFIPLSFLK